MIEGYHDERELRAELAALADELGPRARFELLGESVEGRPIDALTIAAPGRSPEPTRPVAVVIGAIHGNEVIASEAALGVAHRLARAASDRSTGLMPAPAAGVGDGVRPRATAADVAGSVLDAADVTVVPAVNPDARARSLETLRRRPLAIPPRRNANGVDLNRNWPMAAGARAHWLPWAGTDLPWLPWYRGPAPCSEPEVRALRSCFDARPPAVLLNLHSVGEIVTYPWSSFDHPSPDREGLEAMVAAFNRARPVGRRFRSKQSNAWYPIVSSSNDFVHDTYGTRAVTVELSTLRAGARGELRRLPRLFWWSNPRDPQSYVAEVVEPCLAAVAAGLSHPRPDGR